MEVRILGPLEVVHDDGASLLRGPMSARLLAMLAAHANEVVPTERLVEALWPDGASPTTHARLAAHLREARRALDPTSTRRAESRWLAAEDCGYTLRVETAELDAAQFLEHADAGRRALRTHAHLEASDELTAALRLWRGPAFGTLGRESCLRADADRLDHARWDAIEDRVDADLALGRHVELCAELEDLVSSEPLRERLCRQYMLALYRSDHQADALRTAVRFRQLIAHSTGAEPGPELQQLEHDILLQKATLDYVVASTRDDSSVALRTFSVHDDPRPPATDQGLDILVSPRTLVGRRGEQRWLLDRLHDAASGTPQVVLLRGEVGVGKSRLARELIGAAKDRGFTTSIGRFREQQSAPFEAFTDDFFQRLADVATEDGHGGSSSEIVRRLAAFGDAGFMEETTEPQRIAALREAFARLIKRKPLVLLVDDVQWADPASREWLVTLVRFAADVSVLEPTPFLAILVVRDEPGVPEIPQLDLIRRESITTSLTLHGLSELEVSRLANEIGVRDLAPGTIRDIARVSRGNPLFVIALVKQFTAARNDAQVADIVSAGLPSEIQGLIGRRVATLSSACREMLTMAAVLGGGWDLDELRASSGIPPRELGALLDEAEAAGVIVMTDRYEFAHPLYERASLGALASRSLREAHLRVANVLIERHARQPGVSVMRLAQHLLDAGHLADPGLLVTYCPSAGHSASAAFAWEDAARYFEAALRASERTGEELGEPRASVALQASAARLQSGEPALALQDADLAIASVPPNSREELALAWTARVWAELFTKGPGNPVQLGPLEHLAPELDRSAPAVAARVYSILASVYANAARSVDDARRACRKAIDLGTMCEEHTACARAWGQLAVTQWMRLELVEAVDSLQAELLHAIEAGDRERTAHAMTLLPLTLVWLGRFDEADEAILRAARHTRDVSYSLYDGFVLVAEAIMAAARGMYLESDAAVEDAIEIGRLTGDQWPTSLIMPVLAMTRSLRGDGAGTDAVLAQWAPPGAPPDRVACAWLLQQRVNIASGRPPARDQLRSTWRHFSSQPRVSADTVAALVIELAVEIGDAELAGEAAAFLEQLDQRGQRFTTTMGQLIPRLIGIAAAASGDVARARAQLETSIAIATDLRAHAELAMSQYALASVLAESVDPEAASELLERASRTARAIGLAPLAHRCFQLAERFGLTIRTAHELPTPVQADTADATGMAVVLFTDIVDSVALTEDLGDWVFHDRSRLLQASLRETIRDFAGLPVEGIKLGDGILAEFRSAERAVSCAIACSRIADEAGMPLHIGAHAGDVIRSDGDIFGGAVNTAARICSQAPAGEILVSQTLRDLARTSSAVTFTSVGPHALKGIAEPVTLFSVQSPD